MVQSALHSVVAPSIKEFSELCAPTFYSFPNLNIFMYVFIVSLIKLDTIIIMNSVKSFDSTCHLGK